MIVTIDGPAGAGKSTLARELARRLDFEFLDTGALYRAVTLAAMREQIGSGADDRLEALLERIELAVQDGRVMLGGEDVSSDIRSAEVTANIKTFADSPLVRQYLNDLQRRLVYGRNVVTEGRDQGTIVFPEAQCKFFLTASPEARAQRRLKDYQQQGRDVAFEQVLEEQQFRDDRDEQRAIAPLKPASDAIPIDSSEMDVETTLDVMLQHVSTIL